jgi:ER lumen protein retaining receptor
MDIWLFVLGYVIQLIASGLLIYRIASVRSVYGLSLDTQLCFLSATLSRAVWSFNTRILDSHPLLQVFAVIELALSIFCAGLLVYLFRSLRHTSADTQASPLLTWKLLFPVSIILAGIVNPGSWFTVSLQILVAFTMYMEAVALVPQLALIRKMSDVEALTSHYIGLLVIARAVRMCFWVVLYMDGSTFICLFLADLFHTVLCADYMYLWVRKLRHGGRLVYTL